MEFVLVNPAGLDAVAMETHHFFINFFFHIASEIEREKRDLRDKSLVCWPGLACPVWTSEKQLTHVETKYGDEQLFISARLGLRNKVGRLESAG
ncbi:hypothetical protein DAPPUDRAFT_239283 [Daphnia pulex]|uniref:Uncharacterized protein n=1 Tax=Daphnia pulex TaxID=6669 RepID=E9G8V6_DAPPU|nr:hypothetical protein DAPPUDRAFT_239283 [Daphnia pulex]|eukprot:EFX84202.1 hypothetical protein DAPPUDRAFT_239283 [Daphnia pulex]